MKVKVIGSVTHFYDLIKGKYEISIENVSRDRKWSGDVCFYEKHKSGDNNGYYLVGVKRDW